MELENIDKAKIVELTCNIPLTYSEYSYVYSEVRDLLLIITNDIYWWPFIEYTKPIVGLGEEFEQMLRIILKIHQKIKIVDSGFDSDGFEYVKTEAQPMRLSQVNLSYKATYMVKQMESVMVFKLIGELGGDSQFAYRFSQFLNLVLPYMFNYFVKSKIVELLRTGEVKDISKANG